MNIVAVGREKYSVKSVSGFFYLKLCGKCALLMAEHLKHLFSLYCHQTTKT